MPQSSAAANRMEHDNEPASPVEAGDLFEQMLEAAIRGNGSYGADPDLDLIEERLSQLRQVSDAPPVSTEPAVETLPIAETEAVIEIEPVPAIEPEQEQEQEIEPEPNAPAPPPPAAPVVAARAEAPPVVVSGNRPAGFSKPATSADAVVLEAARAAGVAPAYRQPAASQKPQPAAAPRPRRKRASGLPSFYFAVLTLLLASFALFAVWRSVPDQVIDLPEELVGSVAVVAPVVPSLPARAVKVEAPVDPQITASVSDMPSISGAELSAPTPRQDHAPRRIVKLYRVDAGGNIIGLQPTP